MTRTKDIGPMKSLNIIQVLIHLKTQKCALKIMWSNLITVMATLVILK